MARRTRFRIGQLGLRLALVFVGVALAAIVVLTGLTAAGTGPVIMRHVMQQEHDLARAIAIACGASYVHSGWSHVDLAPVFDLVAEQQATAQVRGMDGKVIGSSPGFDRSGPRAEVSLPIMVRGRQVGQAAVRLNQAGIAAVVREFEEQQWRARLGSAGIAALLALAVSLIVSWRITLPLDRLLDAVRARGSGDRGVRISDVRGVGVLSELAVAFNQATESLDRQERNRRNLVADVAHELRTPVAILQASHEAMLDGITEPTPENLGSLRDEALRLGRMIEDLQRLAAAEAAAVQLELAPNDLAPIAAKAADSLGDSFGTAGVRLMRRLVEVQVMCDPFRMHEVVTNLLTNALKFTPAGGSVILETEPAEPSGRFARLRVSDTGVGISSDELPRVTERFFRGHRSAEVAGSGIGLTIVEELVRAHGGNLDVASDRGKGTQVTVSLPVADRVEPLPTHQRRRSQEHPMRQRSGSTVWQR